MAKKKAGKKKAATKKVATVKEEKQTPSEESASTVKAVKKPQHDPNVSRIKVNSDTQRNEMCTRNNDKGGWVTSTGSVVPFTEDERATFGL